MTLKSAFCPFISLQDKIAITKRQKSVIHEKREIGPGCFHRPS